MPIHRLKKIQQHYAPAGSFIANVLTLISGAVFAQALPVLLSPILTRLYQPRDFGLYALYTSIASVMTVVATGRYELAIMLPRHDEDAASLTILSLGFSVFVSLLTVSMIPLFGSQLASLLKNHEIQAWLYFIPITVLLSGFSQCLNYWCNRAKKYSLLAKGGAIQSISTAVFNLLAGAFRSGPAGLILGGITGLFMYGYSLGRRELFRIFALVKSAEPGRMWKLAATYRDMPLFSTMEAFVGMVALQLPVLFMTSFYSVEMVGHYSLAYRVIMLPMGLVGSAVGQVFYQRFTETLSVNGNSSSLLLRAWSTLGMVALVPSLVLFFFAPHLFSFFFGTPWQEAGRMASYLSVLMFITFVFSTTSFSHVALRIQHISFLFAVVSLVCKIGIIYGCYRSSASFYTLLKLIVAYEILQCITMNCIAFLRTVRLNTAC